ncbi:helix-turn-helix domain-containing protein [Asticcacaulis sp. W401b]|uniref:helix-turn-helix domain-containing protein n=1 Tax=Asticcacaulis sp. W401b TaxID=3388666 RepID=UPI003970CA94
MMTHIRRAEDIGRSVRRARKGQGLTQEQLASTSGVGVRYLRELEQGKESCHIGKALIVLSMLGLTLELHGISEDGDGRGLGAGRGNGDGSGWG